MKKMKSNKKKLEQLEFQFIQELPQKKGKSKDKVISDYVEEFVSKLEEFGYNKRDSLAHCCLDNVSLAWANEIGGLDPISYEMPSDDPKRIEIDLVDAYNYLDSIFTPEFRATLSKEDLDWYEKMRPFSLREISDDVEDEDEFSEFSQVAF